MCIPFFHGTLITGLGGMGDAIICLSCGREKYEEHWNPLEVMRAKPHGPEWRDAIEKARNLPNGLNTKSRESDPSFDDWITSKDDVFSRNYNNSEVMREEPSLVGPTEN